MSGVTVAGGMTRQEVALVAASAAAIDPRLATRDEATTDLRTAAWFQIIGDVPLAFALDQVRAAYSEVRDWPLQPAEILQAWRQQQTAARTAQAPYVGPYDEEPAETLDGGAAKPSVAAWLRQALDAAREGRSIDSVPKPFGGPIQWTEQAIRRQRQCPYPDLCACSHTECRSGWLDVEGTVVNGLGKTYVQVERCPHCKDALLMAIDRGIARKPRGGARR